MYETCFGNSYILSIITTIYKKYFNIYLALKTQESSKREENYFCSIFSFRFMNFCCSNRIHKKIDLYIHSYQNRHINISDNSKTLTSWFSKM